FGSLERFTGLLIEHFEGKFPTWLAPEQVRILPISEKTLEAAEELAAKLADLGVRVTVDRAADKVGAKIRNARMERIPNMVILGVKEIEEGTVSLRIRGQEEPITKTTQQFIDDLLTEIRERSL
ncbi:MAG: His/Gly/Thr/Pro-type tRNA ligase C-terminal domain-containing protein, partial [Akkermansiaceae bacterium]